MSLTQRPQTLYSVWPIRLFMHVGQDSGGDVSQALHCQRKGIWPPGHLQTGSFVL